MFLWIWRKTNKQTNKKQIKEKQNEKSEEKSKQSLKKSLKEVSYNKAVIYLKKNFKAVCIKMFKLLFA